MTYVTTPSVLESVVSSNYMQASGNGHRCANAHWAFQLGFLFTRNTAQMSRLKAISR